MYILWLICTLCDSVPTLPPEAEDPWHALWRKHKYDIIYCITSPIIAKNEMLVLFFLFLLLLFVSGYFLQTPFPPSQRSFQGCMQAILVDDQPADLHAVEKGTMGAFENVSLDLCAIIDR